MDRFNRLAARSDRFGVSPKGVAKAMERAIGRRWPRARYIAPFRTRLFLGLYRLLPTFLMDGIFRTVYGINKKHMAARPAAPSDELATARKAA